MFKQISQFGVRIGRDKGDSLSKTHDSLLLHIFLVHVVNQCKSTALHSFSIHLCPYLTKK